jgi:plastocyanin
MFENFPGELQVPPGATIIFKQAWTGEPHTVTGGTIIDEAIGGAAPWFRFFDAFDALMATGAEIPDPDDPPDISFAEFLDAIRKSDDKAAGKEVIDSYQAVVDEGIDVPSIEDAEDTPFPEAVEIINKESEKIFEDERLPWAIDEDDKGTAFIAQNAGQPCFLSTGGPPADAEESCTDEQQVQPEFDGTATYYNSGMIPYEGPEGNTFRVPLSDDIEPGDYWFYCAVHGPAQSTKVEVVERGTEIPSQEEINRQARKEIDTFASAMAPEFRSAVKGELRVRGEVLEGPYAGVNTQTHGIINEFVPKRIRTRVGEPVTWKVMGADHTISFDVPEYFPIMRFADDGEITLNPRLQPPAGGSPKIPPSPPGPPGEGPPLDIDGGTYDGSGFFSSGLMGGEPYASYTLRFGKRGTYTFACLLHPPMVGTVVVN